MIRRAARGWRQHGPVEKIWRGRRTAPAICRPPVGASGRQAQEARNPDCIRALVAVRVSGSERESGRAMCLGSDGAADKLSRRITSSGLIYMSRHTTGLLTGAHPD